MGNKFERAVAPVVLLSLLLTSCKSSNDQEQYQPVPLNPSQLAQLAIAYTNLFPSECGEPDPNKMLLRGFEHISTGSGTVTACETTFSSDTATLSCDISILNTDLLNPVVAHEDSHLCGADSLQEGQIERNQELFYLPKANGDTLSGYRVSRNLDDIYGPYINLTFESVQYNSKTGELKTTDKFFFPLEEIFSYYFGEVDIEKVYGHDSLEAAEAKLFNIHQQTTNSLKIIFSNAGVSFEDLAGYKGKADAKSIVDAMYKGTLVTGIDQGIDDSVSLGDEPKGKYNLLLFFGSAFKYELEKSSIKQQEYYQNMIDALAQLFYHDSYFNLSNDEQKKIYNVLYKLLIDEKAESYNLLPDRELDFNHPINIQGKLSFPIQSTKLQDSLAIN